MGTMTSFLSKEGKWEELEKSLNSIFEQNIEARENKFGDFEIDIIVINEYGDYGQEKLDGMKVKFSGRKVEWFQKQEKDKGQARSLNIILDRLEQGNYKYWIR